MAQLNRIFRRAGLVLLSGGLLGLGLWRLQAAPKPREPIPPASPAAFTSTREITALTLAPDGSVWVGTDGGVLHREAGDRWRKYTRLDGLPAAEVRGLTFSGGQLVAQLPRGAARLREGSWELVSGSGPFQSGMVEGQTCRSVDWNGVRVTALLSELRLEEPNGASRSIPLPASSTGSHVSALLPHGDRLWAAFFGDGLWELEGREWHRTTLELPPPAVEVTALAEDAHSVWTGTRRAGLWEYREGDWRQHLLPDEPYDHNCQALAGYGGSLFVASLEDGLSVRTGKAWSHVAAPVVSSDAPRQMAELNGALYLRHGGGQVDCLERGRWTRDVFHTLPRKQVSALSTDGFRLYAGQWGGWSEFDGKTWTHFLKLPELQGLVVTALCPDGDTLWAGTQGGGLVAYDRRSRTARRYDERHGLTDDWVTTLARSGNRLYAGTFTGGLLTLERNRWRKIPEVRGATVTALAPAGEGGLYVATRSGGYRVPLSGKAELLEETAPYLDPELQALYPVPGGVWVGARTGVFWVPAGPPHLKTMERGAYRTLPETKHKQVQNHTRKWRGHPHSIPL
jgi:ligand-binding sensor domain-containing protein